MIFINFNALGKKSIQTLVSDADRKILTLGSTENAGNSVNLVSGIIHLPSGQNLSVCFGDRCMQIGKAKIRRHILWRLILVCTVCLGPIYGMLDMNGLNHLVVYCP